MGHSISARAIINDYKSLKSANTNKEQLVQEFLDEIIQKEGRIFLEQKFGGLISIFNKETNSDIDYKEIYYKVFPNFGPWKKSCEVFENAFRSTDSFTPLYHSSEHIYRQWVINFKTCGLLDSFNESNNIYTLNKANCIKAKEECESWIPVRYPPVRGHPFGRTEMENFGGNYPFDTPIEYVDKNLLEYLRQKFQSQENKVCEYNHSGYKFIIEIREIDSKLILIKRERKKPNELCSPTILKNWFTKFGINVSLTTTTFLLEHGMPYNYQMIKEVIGDGRGNAWGLVHILMQRLISLQISWDYKVYGHPLNQHAVVAFARLVYYLEPITE